MRNELGMPIAPLRPCRTSGCGALTNRGRCDRCRRRVEQRRGSAASRGYGPKWVAFRKWYLSQYPLCGDKAPCAPATSHSRCRLEGRMTPATDIDHIVRVTGPHDPRFRDVCAVQALCHACHSAKTATEDSTFARS